jgi:hypothetical protein
MTKVLGVLSAAILAASLAGATDAHAQSPAGKWTAEYPTRVSNNNGQIQVEATGTALMTLELKGDSAFGTWVATSGRDSAQTRVLRGTFVNGKLAMSSEPADRTITRLNDSGEEKITVKVSFEMAGEVKGDEIAGDFVMQLGERRLPPMKWSARRNTSS